MHEVQTFPANQDDSLTVEGIEPTINRAPNSIIDHTSLDIEAGCGATHNHVANFMQPWAKIVEWTDMSE